MLATAFLLAVPSGLARTQDDVISITGGPSGETTVRDATFTFAPPGRVIPDYTTCQLDAGGEDRCSSPVSYSGLDLSAHRFTVRAYSSRGGLLGSDSRSWTIVPGQPGPEPPPEPEPPPGFQARLKAPAKVPPSGLATVDASSSTGAIATFAFDLDGNGSYETKCGSGSQAGAVYGKPGSYEVGVMAVSTTGETSTAKATIGVAGPSAPPPSGAPALPTDVTTGGCIEPGSTPTITLVLLLTCPKTVVLGVAEAVAMSGCFERKLVTSPEPRELFVGKAGFGAFVNGLRVNPRSGAASITLDATIKRIYLLGGSGSDASKVRLWIYLQSPAISVESADQGLSWNVASPSVVGTFQGKPEGNGFLGLKTPKFSAPLSFTSQRRAQLSVAVTLPYPFAEVAGGTLVLQTDNTNGPLISSFTVTIGNVPLGIFEIKDVKLSYSRQGKDDVWSGGLTLVFPPPGSTIIAKGSLGLRNGNFDQASAFFEKPTPGYGPIGCCIFMTKFGGTLKTSSIEANATLTAGPAIAGNALVSLDGTVKVSFLTFLIQGKGKISIVGIPVANGSVTLTDNGVYFLGSINKTFAGVLKAKATITGGLFSSGAWNATGSGALCIDTSVKEFCAGGGVAISNKGVAGCVSLSVADVGAAVYWNGGWKIFWECSFGALKSKVGAVYARATAGASAPATEITIRAGLPRALVHLTGAGDAPRVRVEGPDGTAFDVPGAGGDYFQDGGRFVLRLPEKRTTDIVLLRPAAGTWRITPLPGSPRIVSVEQAEALPTRIARGEVSGTGHERTLRFTTSLDKGQRVSFVERAKGIEHLIGTTSAAKGELRFDVADGPAGPHRIDAVIGSGGIPVRTETVARFRAPGPLLLPAPRVVATRTARGLSIRWNPVRGAKAYRVRVSPGDGRLVSVLRKGGQRSLVVPQVDARTPAAVSVWALSASYRQGRAGRSRVARLPSISVAAAPTAQQLLKARSLVATCVPAADDACSVELRVGSSVVGRGAESGVYGRPVKVRARLTAAANGLVRPGATLRIVATVPGDGTRAVSVRLR